jgi:DNA modification methylase
MKEYKLTKELLNSLREIDGFPLGRDEDIVALSDPPHYTACPNPWIEEFIREHGKLYDEENDDYKREPLAADITEGKNDPIYNAHSYHTKVPYKAIMRYILHYTVPGDIVFDGFCGTGMTGVAAQMCGDRETVESLGYRVDDEGNIYNENGEKISKLGVRYAILNDLSPAATFIAYNYNTPVDVEEFEREAKRILEEVETECEWMYETRHVIDGKVQIKREVDGTEKPIMGKINYVVWSDVFVCPSCQKEFVFWDVAVDKEAGKVLDEFNCPHCNALLKKKDVERAWVTKYDKDIGKTIKQAKQVPVLINYTVEENGKKKRYEKAPDEYDLELLKKIEEMDIPYWYPTDPMMFKGEKWGDTWRAGVHFGITHVHHFYTKRNLWVLAAFWKRINEVERYDLMFLFTSLLIRSSKQSRFLAKNYFQGGGGWVGTSLSGTLFIPSLNIEVSPIFTFNNRMKITINHFETNSKVHALISTQSAHHMPQIPSNSIDYIFTDPPFGGNLMYSELNFLWEAWLRVFTNNEPEAVINSTQGKGLLEYQRLMEACFKEFYRVLKPGRWMTVEFHNSQNSVWNAIQEALQRAGFVIADVRILDKKQGTFKQVTSTSAVKKDLIISAYKPSAKFERTFAEHAETEKGVWEFIEQHLEKLPMPTIKDGKIEVIAERQKYLLYDRMVAYYIQHGFRVPISAAEFYRGLDERFSERDGMYFLPHQVVKYDALRVKSEGIIQLTLSIKDEKAAILWLRNFLKDGPKEYSEIYPEFVKNLHQERHEKMPELKVLLEENFLQDENGRWYIPDPNNEADLERIRRKRLLKEFNEYVATKGKLKYFRTEAIRVGFEEAWKNRYYETIVKVAERLPERVLQEDPALLMFYDNAVSLVDEKPKQMKLVD